jgi:uncharacterized protein (DUF1778 family)
LSVQEEIVSASARLEFRLAPADRVRIERAAELAGEPVTSFARAAAEERADRILREHDATTTVPAAFFDDLIAAMDAPVEPNPALVEATAQLAERITRD